MDKHTRPYHCTHPTCAELEGFTYRGGLKRHEAEKHHMHGGELMFCPHIECNRHTEKPFGRPHNLRSHISRRHPEVSERQPIRSAPRPLKRKLSVTQKASDNGILQTQVGLQRLVQGNQEAIDPLEAKMLEEISSYEKIKQDANKAKQDANKAKQDAEKVKADAEKREKETDEYLKCLRSTLDHFRSKRRCVE
jgi:hypothetical protein